MKNFFLQRRVLLSLGLIAAVALIVSAGTNAFFSDTESSTNNSLTAGAIDLSLGGTFSSANNNANGSSSYARDANNNGRALYSFTDLKPGDTGGGSFNLQVTSNEAYVCAKSTITSTPENIRTYPELNAGDTTFGTNDGELQNFLKFATFNDANTNGVYDAASEPVNVGQYIPLHDSKGITAAELSSAGWAPVADNSYPNTWIVAQTLPPATLRGAGMLYCFGNFTTTGSGPTTQVTGCDGSGNQNVAQTDGVVGSIEFSAVQTRDNAGFTCASLNPIVVNEADLAANIAAVQTDPTKWFFYNDDDNGSGGDVGIQSGLGTTVPGPPASCMGAIVSNSRSVQLH